MCIRDSSGGAGRAVVPEYVGRADSPVCGPGGVLPGPVASTGAHARAVGAAVSYTHLRAHETVLDLVCRLLLEKKKYIDREVCNIGLN